MKCPQGMLGAHISLLRCEFINPVAKESISNQFWRDRANAIGALCLAWIQMSTAPTALYPSRREQDEWPHQ